VHRLCAAATLTLFLVVLGAMGQSREDSPKAATTRKKLDTPVTVDYADAPLEPDVVEDLKEQIKGLGIKLDTAGGVSKNIRITYKADKKPLRDVLDGMFRKNGLGYVVISKKGTAYDGNLLITRGSERGYPAGQEPAKTAVKAAKDTEAEEKPTAKGKTKEKTTAKEKSAPKEETPEDDAAKAERDAARKFGFAKTLADDGKTARAKERLKEIIAKYPNTKGTEQARELLKILEEKEDK
jgi:hypothetical protein